MSLRRFIAALFAVAVGLAPAAAAPPASSRADVQRIEDAIRGRAPARAEPARPAKPDQTAPERPAAPKNDAPVVHLIAAADSNDPDIGSKVGDDARNLAAAFEASFAAAGKADQLRTRTLLGRDTTGSSLLAVVRALPVRPQDTVVVLFSGHGSIDGRDRHTLDIGGGKLARQALLDAMTAHGPRLAVLLTDVCSSYTSGRAASPAAPTGSARDLPRGRVMPWATVENLFLSHRGVVDLTAAEPGFPAAVERSGRGSYFTNALLQVLTTPRAAAVDGLDRNGDRALQWSELVPQVRAVAADRHRADPPATGKPERPQQAHARSLGTWAPPAAETALAP